MNDLERIARALCVADGRNPEAAAWTHYTNYVMAAFDMLANPIPIDRQPDSSPAPDWQYTCTVASTAPPKGLP